jgi:cysteinyl-tRNA synthetase
VADLTERQFRDALDADLNAPEALGSLFQLIQRVNAELDRGGADRGALERVRGTFALMDGVLDVRPKAVRVVVSAGGVTPEPSSLQELSEGEREAVIWGIGRLAERVRARQERNFAESDAIRAEVEARGFLVKDTAGGTVLERYH